MDSESKPNAEREIDLYEQLVSDAFQLKAGDRLQLEKKLLAIAFLLDACSGEGSDEIDGIVACGLAAVLRGAAEDAALLRKRLHKLEQELGDSE